ncbi:hypothetical protein GSI_11824 [Ganoderma sinense ZZ0214-1]|uniref:Uncharacterized protein n=1 Tax=Ganoderma sinense ZZ0214-1 TaxID=1077348 RepID=A0A2G8RX35_9APHY|nr:hypothetical protein GSI_11824 [Ganoderma sinense ZZ0214-1]
MPVPAGACRVGAWELLSLNDHCPVPAQPSCALSALPIATCIAQNGDGMNADTLTTLIKVSRPAGSSFGPILYSIGLIHSPRRLVDLGKTRACLQLLSLSFPLALVVFGINDVYDYASDLRNPRKMADGLEGIILHPTQYPVVIVSSWAATFLITAVSVLTARRHNVLVILALLLLSWQYSAPPLRFKERPLLDSLSNGAIVDLAYLAGYTAGDGLLDSRALWLKGHILGLCTAGVHALGATVDVDVDGSVGQTTIATAFGPRIATAFAAGCYLIAFLVERRLSIFGVYILGGLLAVLAPLLDFGWAHPAFKAVVYWTVAMSGLWFVDRALGVLRRRQGFKYKHI